MRTLTPARINRSVTLSKINPKAATAETKIYTAPIGGWVSNGNLAAQDPQSAVLMDNFWPTETGIEPRGGSIKLFRLPSPVQRLFEYKAGESQTFFAATETEIYAFGTGGKDADFFTPRLVLKGQTSGDYGVLHMQTDAGIFLSIVNGTDFMYIHDGISWFQVSRVSTPYAIPQVDTSCFVQAWVYRNRLFFVEKNSMNVWYLGINSIAGSASKLPLGGLFKKGGTLLFGSTWSSDSGAGMDDRCVFVTDQGEFAVFVGDPVDGWSLTGIFGIGKPLGRHAFMSVGGDLIIATGSGLVPISAAVRKDSADLKVVSLSREIDPDWRKESQVTGKGQKWQVVKWEERNMGFIIPLCHGISARACFVVNLGTRKWARFQGWKIGELSVLGRDLYYGDNEGNVFQADVGGLDDDIPIICRTCFSFDHLSNPGTLKTAHLVRSVFRHTGAFSPRFTIATNYKPSFVSYPFADKSLFFGIWDKALWNRAKWSPPERKHSFFRKRKEMTSAELEQREQEMGIHENWSHVEGCGYVLAIQLELFSSAEKKLDCELISVDLTYSVGGILP